MKNRKLKIAVVSDAIYPYNKGGKEKRIFELTTRLAKAGYDVHIYCMKWWKSKNNHRIENGIQLHAISNYYPLYSGKRRSFKQAILFSLSCLNLLKEDFDIIDVDHMPHFVLFTTKIVCLIKRKKLIATWHEYWGKEYWNEYLGRLGIIAFGIEWLSSKMPDEIIAVSEDTKRKLQKELNIKKKIYVVPNGIDIETIKRIRSAKMKSDVIYAGRLLEHKNVNLFIAAINELKMDYPKIKALIIGNGPERKKLEQQVIESKLHKNIQILDFVKSHTDLYSFFKASKVFVFPSTREGFGMAALEANACGLPVITTNHKNNATRELITNNVNGYITELDAKEIAKRTAYYLKTSKRTIPVEFTNKYNWDMLFKEVEKVYTV